MSSDLPPEWEAAMVEAGVVDQRGRADRASRRELARRVTRELGRADPVNTSTITAMINGTRQTDHEIVAATAKVLRTDEVFSWVGQPRRVGPTFVIPDEINLLTARQQDAIRELIRAMAEEREHGDNTTSNNHAGGSPAAQTLSRQDQVRLTLLDELGDNVTVGELRAAADAADTAPMNDVQRAQLALVDQLRDDATVGELRAAADAIAAPLGAGVKVAQEAGIDVSSGTPDNLALRRRSPMTKWPGPDLLVHDHHGRTMIVEAKRVARAAPGGFTSNEVTVNASVWDELADAMRDADEPRWDEAVRQMLDQERVPTRGDVALAARTGPNRGRAIRAALDRQQETPESTGPEGNV